MWRYLGMFLLGCTGVGALYMLGRTQWVSPNSVGIVLNYETQQYEELRPGLHCILSPLRSYVGEVSKQIQLHRLGEFPVKSLDNVDATVQADFTYTIDKPLELYQKVKDPIPTLTENVKSALAAAVQTLSYPKITAAEINALAKKGGHSEHKEQELLFVDEATLSSSASSLKLEKKYDRSDDSEKKEEILVEGDKSDAQRAGKAADFFRSLLKTFSEWGITIHNFRIISIEARHKKVSEALELTAEADVRARAQLKAASSEAATIRTLAEAEKDAQIIRAKGAVAAATELKYSKAALELYAQENRVRVAQALGGGKNQLFIGVDGASNSGSSFSTTSFAAFSANRPRSLSDEGLSTSSTNKRVIR